MDLGAYSAATGTNAMSAVSAQISQYSAPQCFELCGKSFGTQSIGEVSFAAYPQSTVTVRGGEYPYRAAKITDDIVFATTLAGDNVFAGAYGTGGLIYECSMKIADTPVSDEMTHLDGNIVQWTFAPNAGVVFDYAAKTAKIDYGASSIMPPGFVPPAYPFTQVTTENLANGVYVQVLKLDMAGNPALLVLAMNFNKIIATGAAFISLPSGGGALLPIGAHGKILNQG